MDMFFLKKHKSFSFVAVGLVLILIFLHWINLLKPVEKIFILVTKPVINSFYGLSNRFGNYYLNLKSKKELLAENKKLREDVAILMKGKSRFLSAKEENEFLRDQLDYVDINRFEPIIAKVIGKSTDQSQNSLIIDRGEDHGLSVGLPVLGEHGYLIGKVIRTNKKTAQILLINDDFSKISVKIQGLKNILGILQGRFGLGLVIEMIPINQTIKEGDLIVTSGLEENIPDNLIVGQIKSYQNSPEELFQSAAIESLVDFNKITMVDILKEKISTHD